MGRRGKANSVPDLSRIAPVPSNTRISTPAWAIDTNLAERFERALQKLVVGLAKPRGTKDPDKIRERIGRAREKYARAAQHYAIDMTRGRIRQDSHCNQLEQDAEAWLKPAGLNRRNKKSIRH